MKKIYKYILLLLLSGGLLSSCSDDDEKSVYNETNTERFNQQEKELYNLLQSSEQGWKMTYFTDDPRYTTDTQQLGGWSFVFKFTDNQNVTMISDYSQETLTPKESEYEIKVGSTVKLSFVTANWISLLTDSANFPVSALEGYGYKGDNEFLYYGQEGEDLIFRSNREQIEIRFQKATAEDWDNISENIETETLLRSSGELELEISESGELNFYDLSYSPATRYAINRDNAELSFGIGYNGRDIKVIKPIPVGDQLASDFVYDSENNWFISELENGNYVKIILGEPVLTSDVVNDYYFGVLAASGHPINDSSDAFLEIFIDTREIGFNNTGWELYGFFIAPRYEFVQFLFFDTDGNLIRQNRTVSNYSVDNATNTLILEDGGWLANDPNNPDNIDFGNIFDPIHDILFSPQGVRVIPTGTLYQGDPVFYLTSNEDPNITIGTNGIEYP